MEIAKATIKDIAELVPLSHQLSLDTYNQMPDEYNKPNIKTSQEYIENTFEDNCESVVFKAVENDKIVGYLILRIDNYTPAEMFVNPKRGCIESLCVDEKHRRRGIARLLIKEAEVRLKKIGIKKLTLEVYFSNSAAISLYNKIGFYDLQKSIVKDI